MPKQLTNRAERELRAMAAQLRRLQTTTVGRSAVESEDYGSMDIYLAKTPTTGILGLKEEGVAPNIDYKPGFEYCDIYHLIPVTPEEGDAPTNQTLIVEMAEAKELIFNASVDPIPGDVWTPIFKSKEGDWFVNHDNPVREIQVTSGDTRATATTTINAGAVNSLTLTSPGSGYIGTPTIAIAPPTSGVTATATLVPSKMVRSIAVTTRGSGYTSAPTVSFSGGGGGTGAAATANVLNGEVISITVTNSGNDYTSAPAVAFAGGGGTGAAATATVVNSGKIKSIALTQGGSGYTVAPAVTITSTQGSYFPAVVKRWNIETATWDTKETILFHSLNDPTNNTLGITRRRLARFIGYSLAVPPQPIYQGGLGSGFNGCENVVVDVLCTSGVLRKYIKSFHYEEGVLTTVSLTPCEGGGGTTLVATITKGTTNVAGSTVGKLLVVGAGDVLSDANLSDLLTTMGGVSGTFGG